MRSVKAVDVVSALRGDRLFGVFGAAEMEEVAALGRTVSFDEDERIFERGAAGDCVYAILQGRVSISVTSPGGKTVLLNVLGPGDVLGEISLLDGRERTADATAAKPSVLFRLDRDDFLPFVERHSGLCMRMLGVLCERVRWVSENIEDVVFLDVPRRLAKRLLLLADAYGRPTLAGLRISRPLTPSDLARQIGVGADIVERGLRALQKAGAITYVGGFVVLTKPAILKDMAEDPERD